MKSYRRFWRCIFVVMIFCNTEISAKGMSDFPYEKVHFVPLSEVRLLPGRFYDNMKRDSAWMVSISVNSLIHSFRNNAGVFAGREGGYFDTPKLGGWESLDCDLRGHTTGHLLSAFSLMYASTGSEVFKLKGDSIVNGLVEVKQALGDSGYLSAFPETLIDRCIEGKPVWAPWYTLHKILAGLIDQYIYANNETALEIAVKMGNWAYGKVSALDSDSLQRMIKNEYGGINEAFYNLYSITKDKRFFHLAELFYKADNIDPLKNSQDRLGTLHANTFIPKVIAEARRYELTGEVACRQVAEYFQKLIDEKYSYVTGEIGDKEHFFDPTTLSKHLSGYAGETCCTYNELKLCRHIFSWNADAKVMDYYERALFNQILGQQDPESGMVCYFTPMLSGAYKLYSTPNNSFWCCVGSGFENHARYGECIYAYDAQGVFVNLFISSSLNLKEKEIVLQQVTDFPQTGKTNFVITQTPKNRWTLFLRCPEWAKSARVSINGKPYSAKRTKNNYLILDRNWKSGDKISMTFSLQLQQSVVPGNMDLLALKYGPIVLAGEMMKVDNPFSNPQKNNDYYTFDFQVPSVLDNTLTSSEIQALKKIPNKLEFITPTGKLLKPLYDIHHARYVVYWGKK